MVELLSIACLSIATKFSDTITTTLHEIQVIHHQLYLAILLCIVLLIKESIVIYLVLLCWLKMNDLEHLFNPSTIQQMELMLLDALQWRLATKTAYSFIELFTWNFDFTTPRFHQQLIMQVNEFLLGSISGNNIRIYNIYLMRACMLHKTYFWMTSRCFFLFFNMLYDL